MRSGGRGQPRAPQGAVPFKLPKPLQVCRKRSPADLVLPPASDVLAASGRWVPDLYSPFPPAPEERLDLLDPQTASPPKGGAARPARAAGTASFVPEREPTGPLDAASTEEPTRKGAGGLGVRGAGLQPWSGRRRPRCGAAPSRGSRVGSFPPGLGNF